jgi:hypothetical protein
VGGGSARSRLSRQTSPGLVVGRRPSGSDMSRIHSNALGKGRVRWSQRERPCRWHTGGAPASHVGRAIWLTAASPVYVRLLRTVPYGAFVLSDRTSAVCERHDPDEYSGCVVWHDRGSAMARRHRAGRRPNPRQSAQRRTAEYPGRRRSHQRPSPSNSTPSSTHSLTDPGWPRRPPAAETPHKTSVTLPETTRHQIEAIAVTEGYVDNDGQPVRAAVRRPLIQEALAARHRQ